MKTKTKCELWYWLLIRNNSVSSLMNCLKTSCIKFRREIQGGKWKENLPQLPPAPSKVVCAAFWFVSYKLGAHHDLRGAGGGIQAFNVICVLRLSPRQKCLPKGNSQLTQSGYLQKYIITQTPTSLSLRHELKKATSPLPHRSPLVGF